MAPSAYLKVHPSGKLYSQCQDAPCHLMQQVLANPAVGCIICGMYTYLLHPQLRHAARCVEDRG